MRMLRRIKHIATADIHNFLDTFEDPVSMVKQYLREIEEQLDKAQAALANQLVVERRYDVLLSQTEGLIGKRTRQANLALDRGEEEVALIALQDKISQEEKLQVYREQQATVKRQTAELTEELNKLTDTYNDLQTRKVSIFSCKHRRSHTKNRQSAEHLSYGLDFERFCANGGKGLAHGNGCASRQTSRTPCEPRWSPS